jgi:hypothetical protein
VGTQRVLFGLASAATIAVLLLAVPPRDAEAIPAFARQYNVSCALCHNPAPSLTDFGEEFAGNGFQMAKGEELINAVDTGDDLLTLMDALPLAVRFDGYVRANAGSDLPSTDLETPWTIKLLSGGQIAPNVSYYMYFFMSERGEVAGLEDAYVQFSDIGGTGIDLLVGQFQVSDPLFKRELRLEFEDYQPYRVRVGETRADLTYDRGLMAVYSPWDGGDLSFQVVNGRGIGHATDAKHYDEDDGKNVAARFSQSFGPIRVGGFGYFGTESAGGFHNGIRIYGPDLTLDLGPTLRLNGQYLRRTDDYPFFSNVNPTETSVDMGFAEVVWSPQGPTGRWFFTGLYNHVSADAHIFTVRQGESGYLARYRAAAVGGNYLLARNFRWTAEVLYDVDLESYRFITGFVSAF